MPQSLAARVRTKYPGAYDDLDDAALERAVLAKHPEYADLAAQPAESATSPAPSRTAIQRFFSGVGEQLNPLTAGEGLIKAAMHPMDTLGNLAQAQVDEGNKAFDLMQQGRLGESFGHSVATLLPVVGPAAARIGDELSSALEHGGDVATALGHGAGLVASVPAPRLALQAAGPAFRFARSPIGRVARHATGLTLPGEGLADAVDVARTAVRAMRPGVSTTVARTVEEAQPVDAAGRDLGGYAGPERRGPSRVSTPDEDALYAASRADRVRNAENFKQTSTAARENETMRRTPPPEPEPDATAPPPRWQPDPADVEAERAFKRGLVERANRPRPPIAPVPAHGPAIGPANYFLRKPGSEPSFMGFGNAAPGVDALAQQLAETLGMTTDDALTLIESQPEMKSVTKDAMRRAVSGKGRR